MIWLRRILGFPALIAVLAILLTFYLVFGGFLAVWLWLLGIPWEQATPEVSVKEYVVEITRSWWGHG